MIILLFNIFFIIILYMLLYIGIRGWESRIGYDYCVCVMGGGLDKFVGSLWDIYIYMYICMCSILVCEFDDFRFIMKYLCI